MRGFWEALRRNIEKQRTESAWRAEPRPPERITSMLRSADATTLLRLDREFRQGHNPYLGEYGYIWDTMPPGQITHVPHFGSDAAICGLFSFHRNGYVREQAVIALARIQTGLELPFLLLRLDDWVAEVRGHARAAAHDRMTDAYTDHWKRCVPIILRLMQRTRITDQPLLEVGLERIRAGIHDGELPEGLHDSDAQTRRWWTTAVLDSAARRGDLGRVAVTLLGDADIVVRTLAANRLLESGGSIGEVELLERLVRDRAPAVRRLAIDGLCRSSLVPEEITARLLLDRSAGIRTNAAQLLAPRAGIDPAAFYRQSLSGPDHARIASAINGLTETGLGNDAELIRRYWDDPRPGVQRAAVGAVAYLQPDAEPSMFLEKLASPLPGVSREAQRALESRLSTTPIGLLRGTFDASRYDHVRKNALRLLAGTGKWRSLPHVIHALHPQFGGIVNERASDALAYWRAFYNRVFTAPTAADLDALEAAIAAHSGSLRDSLRSSFAQLIREWRERIGA